MTQEEKQLLLKDLCARLPYGVKVQLLDSNHIGGITTLDEHVLIETRWYNRIYKPYLRPMSSMMEEELKEFQACHCVYDLHPDFQPIMCNIANELNMFNWLDSHHFDYCGLIPMGLALEAPEGMYECIKAE